MHRDRMRRQTGVGFPSGYLPSHPLSIWRASRGTIPRVADSWPPLGPQKQPARLEHIRDLWVLHGIQSKCVAGLYRNDYGIELRIDLGNELIESRLSRFGEAPLVLIAEEAKQNLLTLGTGTYRRRSHSQTIAS